MQLKSNIKTRYFLSMLMLVLFLSINTPPLSAQNTEDPPLVQSGKMNLLNGEYQQAIIKFSEYLKVYGFSNEAYYWRAHTLLQMGEVDKAMIDLQMVLNQSPKDGRTMDALGYANTQIGEYSKAIEWFNKAIEQDNNSAIIYNNRGMSFYYLGKYSKAFSDFNKAVQLDSTFAQAYSNRGSARYNNQDIAEASTLDLKKAESDYSKAIQLDNRLVSAYRNRGIIRYNLDNFRESFLDFKKAIFLNPADPIIYFHMGNLMFAQADYHDAVNYYNQCLSRKNNLKEALYKRAKAHEMLRNFTAARFDYEIIIQQDNKEKAKCIYLIAVTYALEENRDRTNYFLNQARRNGYFKSEYRKKALFKEAAFKPYWKDPSFIKLRERIEG